MTPENIPSSPILQCQLEQCFIDFYITDYENDLRIKETVIEKKFWLNIHTTNMIGESVSISLIDDNLHLTYMDNTLRNTTLSSYIINNNHDKILIKVSRKEKSLKKEEIELKNITFFLSKEKKTYKNASLLVSPILLSTFSHDKLFEVAQSLTYEDFLMWISGIYGFDISAKTYHKFRDLILSQNIETPSIVITHKSSLKLSNHNASYDRSSQTIYISSEIINEARKNISGSHKLLIALAEENGHHFDNVIRTLAGVNGDGPVDEGANFAFHILNPLCTLHKTEVFAKIIDTNEELSVFYSELTEDVSIWLSYERISVDHKKRNLSYQSGGLSIDDVTSEIIGLFLELNEPHHNHKVGAFGKVTHWDNNLPTTRLSINGNIINTPKIKLQPKLLKQEELQYYSTGLVKQKKAVIEYNKALQDQKNKVTKWNNQKDSYNKNKEYWSNSLKVLEGELKRKKDIYDKKMKVFSRMMIRECMYNRFDEAILNWTNFYNKKFSPSNKLNPNIPKSIFFEETRLGTSGIHLELPPYDWNDSSKHPIRSRFNLGQTIDSWGPQHYLMIKEMSSNIYKNYKLDSLEYRKKWRSMTNSEYANWDSGRFMTAIRKFHTNMNGGTNLIGTPGIKLYEDYNFWIRVAVRWLFQKYMDLGEVSWEKAVQAYNGSGQKARNYRNRVMSRVNGKQILTVDN